MICCLSCIFYHSVWLRVARWCCDIDKLNSLNSSQANCGLLSEITTSGRRTGQSESGVWLSLDSPWLMTVCKLLRCFMCNPQLRDSYSHKLQLQLDTTDAMECHAAITVLCIAQVWTHYTCYIHWRPTSLLDSCLTNTSLHEQYVWTSFNF